MVDGAEVFRIQMMLEINKDGTYMVIKCTFILDLSSFLCSLFCFRPFQFPLQSDGAHICVRNKFVFLLPHAYPNHCSGGNL